MPEEISARYPGVDQELLLECRILDLAMVAAWRWDLGDQFPNGQRAGRELVSTLRRGPLWPTLDVVMRELGSPQANKHWRRLNLYVLAGSYFVIQADLCCARSARV